MNSDDLNNRFEYHPANTPERQEAHARVRSGCMMLAHQFHDLIPEGREKSLAITKLEEAMFWANAAIARS